LGKAAKRARKKQGRQARIAAAEAAAQKRRKRNLNLFLVVVVVVIAAAVGYHELTKPKATPAAATPCSTAKPTATPVAVSQTAAPAMTISSSVTYTATVATSCGTFTMVLDAKDTPNGVNSFVYLANKGFYNGLTFHRIVQNFAIQGGDPKGDGTGGPGYQVVDAVPAGVTYTAGTVAFANSGTVGGAGSQFFVVPDAPNVAAAYSPNYSVLGHVTGGLDTTVANLNNAKTVNNSQGEKSKPTPTVYIDSIKISTSS
jgi:cyclophilin family peptidyl-prolyl cis-trans isomerase